jgi:hypothetical protein
MTARKLLAMTIAALSVIGVVWVVFPRNSDFVMEIGPGMVLSRTSPFDCAIVRSTPAPPGEYYVVPANIYQVGKASNFLAGRRVYRDKEGAVQDVYFLVDLSKGTVLDKLSEAEYMSALEQHAIAESMSLMRVDDFRKAA